MRNVILDNYSQEYIFSIYLGISEVEILWCLEKKNRKIHNKHRMDSNPSLGFIRYDNKIIARDYADGRYRGDIFEIVGYVIGENSKSNEGFNNICLHILDTIGKQCTIDLTKSYKEEIQYIKESRDINIEVINRSANRYDYDYWYKYGITHDIVENNIIMVNRYILDNRISKYMYKVHDPCYCYRINELYYKLYFPNRKHTGLPRFITNNKSIIENLDEIKYRKRCIISKSQKDSLLMNRLIKELDIVDIQVVTFSSEIDYLPDNLVKYISNRSSIIYVCFDYDIHGIAAANKLQKGYGYIPMYFGDSYSIKDISDYCKQSGYTNTLKLFKSKFDNVISKNSTIKYTTSNG